MRKLKSTTPVEYNSPSEAIRLSEFGMAVSQAGADFVRVVFSCLVLAVATIVVLLLAGKEPRQYARVIALVSSIPLLFLAGAVLLRSLLPFLNALAELASGQDLDGSGAVGDIVSPATEPPPAPQERIITIRPRGAQGQDARRKRAMATFETFIRGCEHDTTAARWEKVIGRDTYRAWRDTLIQNGWAEWNSENRNHGWRLTVSADDILEACEFDELARQFM